MAGALEWWLEPIGFGRRVDGGGRDLVWRGFEDVHFVSGIPAMSSVSAHHTPVLADAVLRMANVCPGDVWVDCTLRFAGHTTLLLEAGARVLGIDQDADARAAASERLAPYGDNLRSCLVILATLKTSGRSWT